MDFNFPITPEPLTYLTKYYVYGNEQFQIPGVRATDSFNEVNVKKKQEKICSISQRAPCVAAQKTDKSLEQSSNKFAAIALVLGHLSSFRISGVRAYNFTTKFRPSALLLTNHRRADLSNVISLVKSVDGRYFVLPPNALTLVLWKDLRQSRLKSLKCAP